MKNVLEEDTTKNTNKNNEIPNNKNEINKITNKKEIKTNTPYESWYKTGFLELSKEIISVYVSCLNEIRLNDRKRYKNIYCVNCGEKGHIVKDCINPITSFGILAFKVVNSENEEIGDKNPKIQQILDEALANYKLYVAPSAKETYPKIKFLMIQRKDTMGYIDFVRGKYTHEDRDKMLQTFLSEMTYEEKQNLLTKDFDTLWEELWVQKSTNTYKNEYLGAKQKFAMLNIRELVENSPTNYKYAEFSFAKGRRNMRESNISAAEREFFEETGYDKSTYEFIKNYSTIQEEFTGTNGIRYRHVYYLVKMRDNPPPPYIDTTNKIQAGEVQDIAWLTYKECMSLIRPYDTAKKNVIKRVYNDLKEMGGNYICSNFYYTTRKKLL